MTSGKWTFVFLGLWLSDLSSVTLFSSHTQKSLYLYFPFLHLRWCPCLINEQCRCGVSKCEILANWKVIYSATWQKRTPPTLYRKMFRKLHNIVKSFSLANLWCSHRKFIININFILTYYCGQFRVENLPTGGF